MLAFVPKRPFRGNTGPNRIEENHSKCINLTQVSVLSKFRTIDMSWLDFVYHFLSNQKLHAWSWINRAISRMVLFCGEFGSECLGLFLFCFGLVRGEKVASAPDFGWRSKGEDHFGSWFPFFSYLGMTILYCSDIVWSKDLSAYFFCFLPIFDREFSFLFPFALFQSLVGNFLLLLSSDLWSGTFFFFFFLFSSEGKVYGELGFWLKACRTAGHDICQGVGLASGSGIKGMSHIISMTHMQQWWLGNFMQNWSCMHPCGHSSIKFLWSCDTRVQDSFFPI